MANSMQDQLLKSGLIDHKKSKQAAKTKRQQTNAQRKGQASPQQQSQVETQQVKQANRDRELNRRKQQQAEQKAIDAQIKQLIKSNRIENTEGELAFNFEMSGKIKRIHVNEEFHRRLSNGSLAIAMLDKRFELIPRDAGLKIQQRAPNQVVLLARESATVQEEEDPYAGFEVPDDLMW